MARIFLGYDPGGKGANGVAILQVPDAGSGVVSAEVGTLDSVDHVICWFNHFFCKLRKLSPEAAPEAAGIDTFLSWATGRCGWRLMDTCLRNRYEAVKTSVQSSNSTYGAMAIQGVAAALRLQQIWPKIELNETHPKVLYYALSGKQYAWTKKKMMEEIEQMKQWLIKREIIEQKEIDQKIKQMKQWQLRQINSCNQITINNDHEWDALISAWATWQGSIRKEGSIGNWFDLMGNVRGLLYPAGKKVTYFWPSCSVCRAKVLA